MVVLALDSIPSKTCSYIFSLSPLSAVSEKWQVTVFSYIYNE